ncbi:MAG: glycerol-3-phosphate 1-O-acyltransferase PlsB [Rhodanobacteraceae bacterium]
MSDSDAKAGALTTARSRAPWWFALAGRMLRPWIRIKRDPSEPAGLLMTGRPVCYVLERHGFSDALILERACKDAGLPSPTASLTLAGMRRRFSMFSLARRDGWVLGRTRKRASDAVLMQMIKAFESAPDQDVQLVPVSIFVGRAPARESGWFRVLFSENWVVVGRFRRLLAILLNGRSTVVHFAEPVSLRQVVEESPKLLPARLARKLSRVFRVHFRRIRAAVVGPDLSHRRTVVGSVLDAAPVREAIATSAIKNKLSASQAQRRARKMVMEIAADYSHPVVRSASFILTWFWNKLYDGVAMRHFEQARAAAPGHEVVYVPSHRSHADYLLLSYKLHVSGVVPPHIAAGINLNLPVIGSILRRGGAFFMRRSFKGSAVYSTIFKEYLAQLIDRGVPIEYFIEGGRSRTGRLLDPKGGMLSMTLQAFLRAPRRPVLFQPVYIGYEKLMEGNAYAGELSGQAKEKESLLSLLRGAGKVLRQHYGNVTLSFGEPVALNELLDATAGDWRAGSEGEDAKPAWFSDVVDTLARQIQVNINAAAEVNPVNLLALVLLATRKHAMSESDLIKQLQLTRSLLVELPYSDRVSVTDALPAEIIAHGQEMGWIKRIEHAGGDVLLAENDKAILLSYFRNNVLHLMACTGWVACCFVNNRRMSQASVLRLGRIIYPFIQGELFLRWDEHGFNRQLQATISEFIRNGLLDATGEGRLLERGPGQEDAAFQLRTLAHSLMQAFERYYIVIAALVKNGQGALSTAELESHCTSTAQRLSMLHELNAPEFFDKSLFRGFIRRLRERELIWTAEDGSLEFDPALADVVEDARLILSREVRHSILKITPGNGHSEESPPDFEDSEAD